MKESLLKKEFKKSDVQRVRNLVNKDFTASTKTQTGYQKKFELRVEGDIWEEDGRKWTIKNGLKQNFTRLDAAKEAYKIPLTCPKCKTSMNYHLHKKMYRSHGFCFDCTIDYESNLKKLGKYEDYEKAMMQGNMKEFAKDLEQFILDKIDENQTFVTEQGDVEDWKGNTSTTKEKVLEELGKFTEHIQEALEK